MKVKKGRGTLGVKGWRGEKKRLEEEEDKGLRHEKEKKETMCRETMKKQSHTPELRLSHHTTQHIHLLTYVIKSWDERRVLRDQLVL